MSRPSSSTSARTTTPAATTPNARPDTTSANCRPSATRSPSTPPPEPPLRRFSDQPPLGYTSDDPGFGAWGSAVRPTGDARQAGDRWPIVSCTRAGASPLVTWSRFGIPGTDRFSPRVSWALPPTSHFARAEAARPAGRDCRRRWDRPGDDVRPVLGGSRLGAVEGRQVEGVGVPTG